ncbi:hypothetical protein D8B30_05770 [Verminephrobacter eiseniae]|nr:hypothetical protein [Verminephrobacter eiseniae]MCW5303200.1 hypothetical protein [Verminephrobacter eiseniae]MCW8189336.1 hypothetical protein [Verminephrobacter eiseniae]
MAARSLRHLIGDVTLVSRHRSSVGLRWPSKRIAALHRLPIRSVLAARCALRCAPMAARSLRHLIGDATLAAEAFCPTTMGLYTTPCTDSAVARCRVGRFRVHGGSPHESLAVHSRQQALFAH